MAICKNFVGTWIFIVWFQFGKFCYENYKYKEQTRLKKQLGYTLKFSFLCAFSLANGHGFMWGYICVWSRIFPTGRVCFSVMVSVWGKVITSILSQLERPESFVVDTASFQFWLKDGFKEMRKESCHCQIWRDSNIL